MSTAIIGGRSRGEEPRPKPRVRPGEQGLGKGERDVNAGRFVIPEITIEKQPQRKPTAISVKTAPSSVGP